MILLKHRILSDTFRNLLILVVFCLKILPSFPSDILGSDLSWIGAGKDSFIISCDLYSDCRSTIPAQITITFRYLSDGRLIRQDVFPLKSSLDVTGTCTGQCTKCNSGCTSFGYGIKKLTFTKLIVFSNLQDCEILFYPDVQSRPYSINTGPGGQNFYTYAIFNHCISDSNRSPIFTNPPVTVLCNTSDIIFDPGMLNPAEDSIIFTLTTPLSDSAHPCTFSGKFAYDKPLEFFGFPDNTLPFPQGFHLDKHSGIITFRPVKTGESVFSLKVEIFRKNSKIGETRREFGVISINCNLNNFPLISGKSMEAVCAGNSLKLSFSTSDIDADDTIILNCIHQLKNAQWKITSGNNRLPSAILTWTPSPADMLSNPHVVYICARDNNCPINAQTIRKVQIYVWPDTLKSDLNITKMNCGQYSFSAIPLNTGNKSYHSQWSDKNGILSTLDSFVYKFHKPGQYIIGYDLIADSSCSNTKYIYIETDTFIYAELPPDTHLCFGDSITLVPDIHFPAGHICFIWNTNDTSSRINTGMVNNDITYYVTVSDPVCTSTDTIHIYAGEFIFFYPIPDLCANEDSLEINQFVTPQGGKWSCNDSHFLKGNYIYPLKAGSGSYLLKYEYTNPVSGCYSIDSEWVNVNPVPSVSTLPIPPLCRNSPPLDLSPFGSPSGGEWSCSSSAGEKNNILYPDKLIVGSHKLYYTVYNQSGCSNTDTLTFFMNNSVNLTLTTEDSKTNYCSDFKKVKLNASPVGGTLLAPSNWIVDSCYFNPSALENDSVKTVSIIYHFKHSSGCEVEKTLNINVLHYPEITIDKTLLASCFDTILLKAQNRYSSKMEWFPVPGEASGNITDKYLSYLIYVRAQEDISRGYFTVAAKTTSPVSFCPSRYDTCTILIYNGPIAGFSVSDTNPCTDSLIEFYDHSIPLYYPIRQWFWDFGDGNISLSPNPVHIYHLDKEYVVNLTVTDEQNCSGTTYRTISVKNFSNLPEAPINQGEFKIYHEGDIIRIEYPEIIKVKTQRLFNCFGQSIACYETHSNMLIIQKNITPGIYFLEIISKSGEIYYFKLFI